MKVDIGIPTVPLRIVGRVRGTGASVLIGSANIPKNKQGQLTIQKFISGSTGETWFAVTTTQGSGRGTVDLHILESMGQETITAKIDEPIESFPPGTVYVRAITTGTQNWYGAKMRIDLV